MQKKKIKQKKNGRLSSPDPVYLLCECLRREHMIPKATQYRRTLCFLIEALGKLGAADLDHQRKLADASLGSNYSKRGSPQPSCTRPRPTIQLAGCCAGHCGRRVGQVHPAVAEARLRHDGQSRGRIGWRAGTAHPLRSA